MYLTESPKNLEISRKLIAKINQIIKSEENVLKQVKAVKNLLESCAGELKALELDYALSPKKKYKKTPLYEGAGFALQAFVWKGKQGTVTHGHLGEWGVILVLDGEITTSEYKITGVDFDKSKYQMEKTNEIISKAGQTFALIQNFNALHEMQNSLDKDFSITVHLYQTAQKSYSVYKPEENLIKIQKRPKKK